MTTACSIFSFDFTIDSTRSLWLLVLITLSWTIDTSAQSIRYVKQDGTGDGSSWAMASGDLQAMIDAEEVQQVWVAAGTYRPIYTTNLEVNFSMKNQVSILGGFPDSGNPNLSLRNPASYTSILSSDPFMSSTRHIIRNYPGLTATAVLDGFTITGGYAVEENVLNSLGGGIYNNGQRGVCSPTIRNCVFIDNTAVVGGAIYNDGSHGGNSSPLIINCSFINNRAEIGFFIVVAYGGAICNDGSYNGNSAPQLINCSFINNSAYEGGGAIFNEGRFSGNSSPSLINCSFLNDSAPVGGALYSTGALGGSSNPQLTNCVFFKNGGANTLVNGLATVSASYSLFESTVMGYSSGPGNLTGLTTSPFSSSTTTQLAVDSPATNAGDPASTTVSSGLTDLVGNPRIQNGRIDMGAYELGLPSDLTPVIYARSFLTYGTSPFTVVVDVVELNAVATNGSFAVWVTRDQKIVLSFDASLNKLNGRSIANSVWGFDSTNPHYYILTTSQSVAAGDRLSFGLTGTLSPGASSGIVTVSATVLPATVVDAKLTNNMDADKVEYFQQ